MRKISFCCFSRGKRNSWKQCSLKCANFGDGDDGDKNYENYEDNKESYQELEENWLLLLLKRKRNSWKQCSAKCQIRTRTESALQSDKTCLM